ncbi:MAG TPA: PAS domain S-box protein [Dehalococcoidia bacterium]|jgi:PAS domain S-box-containing protein|nr:PAS domain S-box protein [Dehalococcoidia bacterium]
MTLRRKTLLIIGSMFLGLIVMLSIISQSMLRSYADMPRVIYEQVQFIIVYLILAIVAVGLVFGLATILLLEKQVISRLSRLSKVISSIGRSGDISARISLGGTDELSNVAATINGMLAALEESAAELRQSEERYRRLAENATDIIWTMDMSMRLSYISPSVSRMLGYSVEETMNRTMPELFTPRSFEAAKRALDEELAAEKGGKQDPSRSWTLELEMKAKDGAIVPVEVKFTFLRDSDGQPFGILAIARDITERKQAEERLRELYQEERRLRQELEAEINKRVEFTRALVHELKTPMTPVVTASELLSEEVKTEPARSLVESIIQGAYNLNHRIDELLDLAKGEVGMLQLERRLIDPARLLRRIYDSVLPVAAKNGQTINLELADSLPSIWADEDRLRQVVLNLLNNAFKFTPQGGTITLRARSEGAELIVEVQDTGPGISKKDQPLVFEPYRRLGGEREGYRGLGLGLSLAKKLVELHGGRIWVKSQKGKGSTFGFSIPTGAPEA